MPIYLNDICNSCQSCNKSDNRTKSTSVHSYIHAKNKMETGWTMGSGIGYLTICTFCVKRNTHLISIFFCGPHRGGESKIHMVDYVDGSSTHAQFFSSKSLQPF